MSQLLSPTVTDVEPHHQAPAKRSPWSALAKWIFLLLALLWLAELGISVLIQHTTLRGRLTERLEIAFGRPVEVGSYKFSLWGGPALQARSVTVAEDPRFGHEYFLRAESLTVRLLWISLLRGRIRLGTLSLTQPSLNLVRDPEGNWNLSEWLPRPAGSSAPAAPTGIGPRLVPGAFSFGRIVINRGRINFKRGDEKLPYALANVNGTVEAETQGRWRMHLEATAWRAATILQHAGTLHLAGDIGGTSSRLLPAALDLSWTDASLQDVLRLARGDDSGLRGTLGLFVVASTQGDTWNLQGRTELRQLHRWDLALRPDNPAANILAKIQWNPHASELELTSAAIDLPHSNARVEGTIGWGQAKPQAESMRATTDGTQLQILSSAIDLRDFLSWVRAFRSHIPDDVELHGSVGLKASFAGWPPRIMQGSLATNGAELSAASLRVPVRLGPAGIEYAKNIFSLAAPANVSFGEEASAFHIEGSGSWERAFGRNSQNPAYRFHMNGKMAQVRDLISTASSLGWNLSPGWDLAGGVRCDLQWQGGSLPWQSQPKGFIEWGLPPASISDASLRAPFLNQPVSQIAARVDFKPGAAHIALTSAQVFGANWSGSFDRGDRVGEWQFILSAGHLAAADLDRWLNPRFRENFLDRMLPFLNGRPQPTSVPGGFRAAGHINLDQFMLAPLVVGGLQGDLSLDGRHITFENASGQFYGGTVEGTLDAELDDVPVYRVNANLFHADLSPLMAATSGLANLTADRVSVSASFVTRGASRGDLLSALTCQGRSSIDDFGLSNIDLLGSLRLVEAQPGTSSFENASAAFSCSSGQIRFQDLRLDESNIRLGGSGTVAFNGNLDLELRILSDDTVGPRLASSPATSGEVYRLTGPLASPQITQVQTKPSRRAR